MRLPGRLFLWWGYFLCCHFYPFIHHLGVPYLQRDQQYLYSFGQNPKKKPEQSDQEIWQNLPVSPTENKQVHTRIRLSQKQGNRNPPKERYLPEGVHCGYFP